VNSVGNEIKDKLPKIVTSMALALTFAAISIIIPPIFASISKNLAFFASITLILIAGIFLVRALLNVLVISDKAIRLSLRFLGIREDWSRRRALKDLVYIIAIILAAAAVYPFFEGIGSAGNVLQVITTYIAIGLIFLFVYDIGRTLYRIFEDKAVAVADWLVQKDNKEASK
jgi:cation transport ATPase